MKKVSKILIEVLTGCLILSLTACTSQIPLDHEEKVIYVEKAPTEHCLGYAVLEPEDEFKKIVTRERMIYVLNDEFDLKGGSVSIPGNSILVFSEGGKIVNGNVTFNSTYLEGEVKFKDVSFAGTLINKTVNLSWFGATTVLSEEKSNTRKNSAIIAEVLGCMGDTLIVDGFYPVSSVITVSKSVNLRSPDWNESLCKKNYYDDNYKPSNGFFTNGNISIFSFTTKGSMNLFGIYLKGNPDLFKGSTIPTNAGTAALSNETWSGGSIAAVYNCRIEGFMEGIRSIGGYIEKIQNTTFDSCCVGVYALYASDFDIFGCRFTNCMPNLSAPAVNDSTFTNSNMNDLRKCGCGIILEGCGMVNFANNLLENNFVNLQLIEADIIINISDCTFRNPGFCDMYFYNDYAGFGTNLYFTLGASDLQKYCMDNIVVHNNTFERSSKAAGRCVVLLKNRQIALGSNGREVEHDRVTNFVFSNNTVKDTRLLTTSDESIFTVVNKDETQSHVTCTQNSFTNSKASYLVNAVTGSTGKYTFQCSKNSMPSNIQEKSVKGEKGIISFE